MLLLLFYSGMEKSKVSLGLTKFKRIKILNFLCRESKISHRLSLVITRVQVHTYIKEKSKV